MAVFRLQARHFNKLRFGKMLLHIMPYIVLRIFLYYLVLPFGIKIIHHRMETDASALYGLKAEQSVVHTPQAT